MKTAFRWLKPILCFAMLVMLVSCATTTTYTYIPNDSTVQNMSVVQARKVLVTELKGSYVDVSGRNVDIYDQGPWKEITGVGVTTTRLVVANTSGRDRIFQLDSFPNGMAIMVNRILLDGIHTFAVRNDPYDIANALYVLKQNAIKQKKDTDESDARFTASLADYRKKAASNAALPEEANRYKVQAEGAVRDKQFEDAADLYAEALKIAPWWPVGRFNRALILGEIGEYAEAMREMRHYLQLVPDAPNARAAQDKIYDWERLESK